jgi:hypothetical protein
LCDANIEGFRPTFGDLVSGPVRVGCGLSIGWLVAYREDACRRNGALERQLTHRLIAAFDLSDDRELVHPPVSAALLRLRRRCLPTLWFAPVTGFG